MCISETVQGWQLPLLFHSLPNPLCNTWDLHVPLGIFAAQHCSLSCSMIPQGASQGDMRFPGRHPWRTRSWCWVESAPKPSHLLLVTELCAAWGCVPLLWSRTAVPSPACEPLCQAYPCACHPSIRAYLRAPQTKMHE